MYSEIIKYFKEHITYSLIASHSGYRSIKKYKHGFAGPLYIPADDVEDIDVPADKAIFTNMLYFSETGVYPKRVDSRPANLAGVISRLPRKIKDVLPEIPEYFTGFFISERIKIPTLRNPVNFKFEKGTIFPVYIVGLGYNPQKPNPDLITSSDREISKVWFVDMFIPLAIVYTYKVDKNKTRTKVVPVRTIFVGRYFLGSTLPFGVIGEHYAFMPVFIPEDTDTSNMALANLGRNFEVYYESPNDRRVEDE